MDKDQAIRDLCMYVALLCRELKRQHQDHKGCMVCECETKTLIHNAEYVVEEIEDRILPKEVVSTQ